MRKFLPTLVPLVTFLSLGLAACGSDATPVVDGVAPVDVFPPAIIGPGIEECIIVDLSDAVDPACLSVVFNGAHIASVASDATHVTAIASRRGGGTGGSKWFDSARSFSTPVNLVLPTEIPALGNAANGHKLYVKFNDQTDCVWISFAGIKYQAPRCFDGAVRAPGNSVGFTGGVEVDNVRIDGVVKISMTVNGSKGGGTLTIATASFTID